MSEVSAAAPSAGAPAPAPASESAGSQPVHTESSQAPFNSPRVSDRRAMIERLQAAKVRPEAKAEGQVQAPDVTATEGQLDNTKADAEPAEKPEKEASKPDAVPMEAFKKRLADEKRKRDALASQLSGVELDVKRRDQALELAIGEIRRLSTMLEQGSSFDERDEKIHALEFQQKVSDIQQKLQQEHQQALQEVQQRAVLQQRREGVKAFFQQALEKHGDLLGLEELRYAAKKQFGDNPEGSIDQIGAGLMQIADRIVERRIAAIRSRQTQQAPEAPRHVRGAPASKPAAVQYERADAKTMEAWLKARKQA